MVNGNIQLSDWTKYSVTKLMNQKNVYYADWNLGGKDVKVAQYFILFSISIITQGMLNNAYFFIDAANPQKIGA